VGAGAKVRQHRAWVQNQFHHQFVYHELVPGIRNDCNIPTSGSSPPAPLSVRFNALAVTCRFPDLFTKALCLSGTSDLTRFLNNGGVPQDFYYSSPVHFLPGSKARRRRAESARLFASGQGARRDSANPGARPDLLGKKGIPNRVEAGARSGRTDCRRGATCFRSPRRAGVVGGDPEAGAMATQ